jgi:hypothetical protein
MLEIMASMALLLKTVVITLYLFLNIILNSAYLSSIFILYGNERQRFPF